MFDEAKTELAGWLRNCESDSQVFWVSGHTGSGKSTLMKYIAENPATSRLLTQWAQSKSKLTVANFYFWMQGHPMERSQQGLLQSLLFQILRQNIDLIPLVYPDRGDVISPWTLSELTAAYDRLLTCDLKDRHCFCFFIDGLDEYDGEEEDIFRIITKLAQIPNVKLCISSRPWNAFTEAFNACPGLQMHSLTQDDIESYIQAELTENVGFAACVAADARFGTAFQQLTNMAKGVWLWVVLVAKGLKRDMSLGETYEHWQERIRHVPPTLESFFQLQMTGLDPFYRRQTARTLLVMLFKMKNAPGSIFTLQKYQYLVEESHNPDYWKKTSSRNLDESTCLTEKKIIQYLEDEVRLDDSLIKHLKSRCKDLVDIRSSMVLVRPKPGRHHSGVLRGFRIEFLHRTARDFL